MNELSSKLLTLFPEIREYVFEGDEKLPNVMMGHVASWIKKSYNEKNQGNLEHRSIVNRIRELRDWCIDLDDGSEAYTVYVVSLYETICEDQKPHLLIPLITEKEDFMANKDYLTAWVGVENYEAILKNWNKKV
ncbi:hypothetical protein QQ056_10405 [Oscillatoria laete-virens NRMC-F 0139]|nr:hypothetical protein [Oscillatoria laete-virens]MDL5053956.1 hypothetical protein [Oscillatoria laete-virens NRMC-F 0139]